MVTSCRVAIPLVQELLQKTEAVHAKAGFIAARLKELGSNAADVAEVIAFQFRNQEQLLKYLIEHLERHA